MSTVCSALLQSLRDCSTCNTKQLQIVPKNPKLFQLKVPSCREVTVCVWVCMQATNFEEGVASAAEDAANDDNALVMFELYEVLVRLSFAKYINSKEMNDASDALDRLMEENVLPNIPEECLVDPNEFRFNRLYTEEVEEVLVKYDSFLQAIFRVRVTPTTPLASFLISHA